MNKQHKKWEVRARSASPATFLSEVSFQGRLLSRKEVLYSVTAPPWGLWSGREHERWAVPTSANGTARRRFTAWSTGCCVPQRSLQGQGPREAGSEPCREGAGSGCLCGTQGHHWVWQHLHWIPLPPSHLTVRCDLQWGWTFSAHRRPLLQRRNEFMLGPNEKTIEKLLRSFLKDTMTCLIYLLYFKRWCKKHTQGWRPLQKGSCLLHPYCVSSTRCSVLFCNRMIFSEVIINYKEEAQRKSAFFIPLSTVPKTTEKKSWPNK